MAPSNSRLRSLQGVKMNTVEAVRLCYKVSYLKSTFFSA